MKKPDYPV